MATNRNRQAKQELEKWNHCQLEENTAFRLPSAVGWRVLMGEARKRAKVNTRWTVRWQTKEWVRTERLRMTLFCKTNDANCACSIVVIRWCANLDLVNLTPQKGQYNISASSVAVISCDRVRGSDRFPCVVVCFPSLISKKALAKVEAARKINSYFRVRAPYFLDDM